MDTDKEASNGMRHASRVNVRACDGGRGTQPYPRSSVFICGSILSWTRAAVPSYGFRLSPAAPHREGPPARLPAPRAAPLTPTALTPPLVRVLRRRSLL